MIYFIVIFLQEKYNYDNNDDGIHLSGYYCVDVKKLHVTILRVSVSAFLNNTYFLTKLYSSLTTHIKKLFSARPHILHLSKEII